MDKNNDKIKIKIPSFTIRSNRDSDQHSWFASTLLLHMMLNMTILSLGFLRKAYRNLSYTRSLDLIYLFIYLSIIIIFSEMTTRGEIQLSNSHHQMQCTKSCKFPHSLLSKFLFSSPFNPYPSRGHCILLFTVHIYKHQAI